VMPEISDHHPRVTTRQWSLEDLITVHWPKFPRNWNTRVGSVSEGTMKFWKASDISAMVAWQIGLLYHSRPHNHMTLPQPRQGCYALSPLTLKNATEQSTAVKHVLSQRRLGALNEDATTLFWDIFTGRSCHMRTTQYTQFLCCPL